MWGGVHSTQLTGGRDINGRERPICSENMLHQGETERRCDRIVCFLFGHRNVTTSKRVHRSQTPQKQDIIKELFKHKCNTIIKECAAEFVI